MADILIGLAAVVIKAAMKVWLKDDTFAADASASVADLIGARVRGELDQRKARRFFEDLEVPVVKRLRALRQAEFAGLPENEWNAAVLAAGDSFDRAQLTTQDLFSRDLDPLFLEQQIRADSRRATRDLSEGGTSLYGRLVTEGCAYVIEIADKLPRFQAGAFTELLHRDRQILDRIDEVLDRIPDRAVGDSEEARFITACRRHIVTKMDRLELFGLDFEARWYPLSVAYVSLRTEEQTSTGGRAIEDRLAAQARTMLVGQAGSGKTTVLQWLAVSAARASFTGALADLNDHFPFFIRLRDYAGEKLPKPEGLLATSARLLMDEAPRGWVRNQLDSGRALVLVDGVDELPVGERDRVAEWLNDLVQRFPDARYVITARPTAVSADWLADIGFTQSFLEAMPPSLVQRFVRNWHEATRQQLTDSDERERLDSYERALLTGIMKDRYLRDLADTPLLAGLLCALNRYLRSNLPRRRSEIYERALAMFDQRDQARSIVSGGVRLDLSAKTHILAELALWMIRNGESEIASDIATGQIGRSLAGLAGADYQPNAVFRFLLERSGLLRQPAAGRIDFVHRTFQEYLAGRAAIDADATGELVGNAGNDQWREVVVLAAGQANQIQAAQLLQGLLRRNWRGQQRYGRRVLAVASLQEVRSLDPNLRAQVESVVPGLLPPRSMDQAEQLSAAGDPLIPLLASYWTRDIAKAAETIRAASLIGGPAAMDLIHDIMHHQGIPEVTSELNRAWQYFDVEDYAQRVLATQKIEYLEIGNARCLQALAHMPLIAELEIDPDGSEEIDLAVLPILPNLEKLTLSNSSLISGLLKLAGFRNLKELTIWEYPGAQLQELPYLPALTKLDISQPLTLNSLAGIERQLALTKLWLYECKNLTTIQELNSLLHLDDLLIFDMSSLDLSGFEPGSPDITISLYGCGDVDLAPLAAVRNLTVNYDKETRLHCTELLSEDRTICNVDRRFASIWPFK